ncbi:MAG: hypothetical protein GC190_11525 [Alphaproteobacteria bacterium]|nr:hypothetical protein [Alphaproteobacteria bacterium]
MKVIATTMVGAALLASALTVSLPAAARSNVGAYVGPDGVAISIETYRRYCRDDGYRRRHWDRCSRFYGSGEYYPSAYDRHHRRHHRHWDRKRRRWYWD